MVVSTAVVNDISENCHIHTDRKSGDDVEVEEETERVVFDGETHEHFKGEGGKEEEIDIIDVFVILGHNQNGSEIFHEQGADG